MEQKQCEQCHELKTIDRFRKVVNMHTTPHFMSICKDCYNRNLEERKQQQKATWEAGKERRETFHKQQERWPQREEQARRLVQKEKEIPVCHDCGKEYTRWGEAFDQFYCHPCHLKHFEHSHHPVCCVCGERKLYLEFPQQHQGYSLRENGTNIYLYCKTCKPAFLAWSQSQQTFYIRSRCNLVFSSGQMIYGLVCPEQHTVRYIGRTNQQTRRLREHLKDRREDLADTGHGPYYSKGTWMHDLHMKGLQPTMEILMEVQSAPTVIEWEHRYILHGIQQGWDLVNHEVADPEFAARARASQLDFLRSSFADLVQAGFFRATGIAAFIRDHYRP